MRFNANRFDAIIVGAGPSGCMAACCLPEHFKVLLVDATTSPGDKVCGGLLNETAWRTVRRLKMPEKLLDSPGRLAVRYTDIDRSIDKETGLYLYSMSRQKLNAWLESLLPPNVEVWRDTSFVNYRDYHDYVEVELRHGAEHMTLITRNLIGADGARSSVRHQMSAQRLDHLIVVQDWVRAEKPLPPYFDYVFSRTVKPGFLFGYVIPKGKITVVSSVLHPSVISLADYQEQFVASLKDKIGRHILLVRRESGIAARVHSLDDILLGSGRVLLVGEAAGLVSPTSGEGISYALQSGEACGLSFGEDGEPLEHYASLAAPLVASVRAKLGKLRFLEGRLSQVMASHMPPRVITWFSKRSIS